MSKVVGVTFTSKNGEQKEDWRVKHGSKSRIKAGCECNVCAKAAIRLEWDKNREKFSRKDEYVGRAVGMTDLGYIVLMCQRMSLDRSLPIAKRTRARYWYDRLTMADAAPATPILTETGGRRRSHNAKRQIVNDLMIEGPYRRPLIET